MSEVTLFYATFPTRAEAERVAETLLAERLAACVNVLAPCASLYRWEGRTCEEPEVRLTLKTLPSREAALQAFFAEAHPYDVPQFLAVRMQASPAYFDWVRNEVTS